jgi:hypothetical protein
VALDHHFVRLRGEQGKDCNPLNDVRVITSAAGVFTVDKTIKDDPARWVLKYGIGDKLSLTSNGFAKLAPESNANTSLHSGKRGEFQPERLSNSR